jgi:hypothetical protein
MMQAFGDSFVGALKLFSPNDIDVTVLGGASAKGLNTLNSATKANESIRLKINRKSNVLFCFGNVDIHIKFFYKSLTKIPDLTDYVNDIILNYSAFVDGLGLTGEVFIVNIIPPIIKSEYLVKSLLKVFGDKVNKKELEHLFKTNPVIFTIEFRRQLVDMANKALRNWCTLKSYTFIDINKYLVNDNGDVIEQFTDPVVRTNIHLMWEPTIPIWSKLLNIKPPKNFDENYKIYLERRKYNV